jgi:sugar phosphate isomerase/epimerase
MDLFRATGFDSLEMWKHHLTRCRTAELRRHFAEYAKSIGISMGGFNAVGEEYFQPFGSDRELEQTLQELKADTDFALSLGTRDVLIWEGRAPQGSTEKDWLEALLPRAIQLMKAAITYGKSLGARYLVEPHPYTVGMSDCFLTRLCDALDPDSFGVTFDFCHYGVGRPADYIEAIGKLEHRIRHIHYSDSDQQSSELHFPPGLGRLNLQGMLQAFKDIRYNGTITLDLYGYPMPVQALRASAEKMAAAAEFLGIEA